MSIQSNIEHIRQPIPSGVTLVCVSKFHPEEAVLEAYHAGERVFGESKVQELCAKYESLPKDIHWHFIGHLQSNKVKYIVPFVALIHGVDSLRLLQEINKQGEKIGRKISCLLQIHIAEEETKFGFLPEEIHTLVGTEEWKSLTNLRICGLMGMATFTDDKRQVRSEFKQLKCLFEELKVTVFKDVECFTELSMGMSDDYEIAIEEGSTIVRVGSSIFGSRVY